MRCANFQWILVIINLAWSPSTSAFGTALPLIGGGSVGPPAHRSRAGLDAVGWGPSPLPRGLRKQALAMQETVLPPQSPLALSKKTPRRRFQIELPRPMGLILEARDGGGAPVAVGDWEEAVDEETGDTYYWNTQTQETSWVAPAGEVAGGAGGGVYVVEISGGASAEASRGLVLEGDVVESVGGRDFSGQGDLVGVMEAITGCESDPVPLVLSRDESIVAVTFGRGRAFAARMGEPLRSVATRAKAPVQYSCEGGTCGTCEVMSQGTGMYARVCSIPLVPAMLSDGGDGQPPRASFTS